MSHSNGCRTGIPERQNAVRAQRGAAAIAAYIELTGDQDGDDALADLLADLRHHCAAQGLDFSSADARAEVNFEAES